MKSCRITWLLTGTINPHFSVGNKITNVSERYSEYYNNLKYLIENLPSHSRIVFAENSDSLDTSFFELIEVAARKLIELELISVTGPSCVELGKGWCEGDLLKKAYKCSKLLPKSIGFIKLTGRLMVYNISYYNKIITRTVARNKVDFITSHKLTQNMLKTQIFYTSCSFFESNLIEAYIFLNDIEGNYMEHEYARVIKSALHKDFSINYFIVPIPLIGRNGFSGIVINRRRIILIKYFLSIIIWPKILRLRAI